MKGLMLLMMERGVMRMTVMEKRSRLRRATLQGLKGFFLLKFSQMMSEGQGANSRLQFYKLNQRHAYINFEPLIELPALHLQIPLQILYV